MLTSQPVQKIAIVSMDAYFSSYDSLDAFERAIYEGRHIFDFQNNIESVLSATQIEQKLDCVIDNALEAAAISSVKTAIVVANSERLNSSVIQTDTAPSDFVNTDSVFNALLIARELLNKRQAEAVVVAGIDFDPQKQAVGAVVLKPYETAQKDRVYAIIDAIESIAVSAAETIEEIAYLEIVSDRVLAEVEIDAAYLNSKPTYSCAVSSVDRASGIAGEIASLIKTALCIYYRYIPSVPQWEQPNLKWQKSLYVAASAKPWFLEAGIDKRVAAIHYSSDRSKQIILSEEVKPQRRSNAYLEQTPCYLFPLAASDDATLLQQLRSLQQKVADGDIATVARQTFIDYRDSEAHYALVIVGKDRAEILKECDRAVSGVTKAFETGKDWQTPIGSYFTANPLGKKGKVTYVYPGAYNAHLEIGKNLFRLFPNLIDDPVIESTCNRVAKIEKLLYPRSIKKLTPRELEAKERELMNDALAMLESETGFAGLITTILRDCFQIKPQAAFGYSQGEISMMHAQGVWSDINRTSDIINTSELFKTRLAGSKDAVREYWQDNIPEGELWRAYVAIANSDDIKEKLQTENRVYLTQVNSETECIIAGDPQGCERVIASLGCDAFRAPFNHVIHCEPLQSEYNELIKLNTLPLRNTPDISFYSAANYGQIELNTQEIAHSLTQNLIQQLDFPRLVERLYQDGYRIFIEVGAGSNCSRWIKNILKSKEHATVSLHRRNSDDFTSLIKALAKLVSHRVPLDLAPLYPQVSTSASKEQKLPSDEDKSVVAGSVDFWHETSESTSTSFKEKTATINGDRQTPVNFSSPKNTVEKNQASDSLILWQPISNNKNFGAINSDLSQAHSTFIDREKTCMENTQKMLQTQIALLQKAIE